MPNVVEITVKAINGTKPIFDEVKRDGEKLGADVAVKVNESSSKKFQEDANSNSGGFARAGDAIGNAMGERISQRITTKVNERLRDSSGRFVKAGGDSSSRSSSSSKDGGDLDREHVSVSVDVDKKSFMERIEDMVQGARDKLSSGLSSWASTFFSGDFISLMVKVLAGGGLAAALGPVLGAAITTAILGGLGLNVIGAGIALAFKDPMVKDAAKELGKNLQESLRAFSGPFVDPILRFFVRLLGFVNELKPQLSALGKEFAPFVDLFSDAFFDSLKELGPGLRDGLDASKPILETLAKHMPKIAEAISKFLTSISEQGDDANLFFDDLLTLVEGLIVVFGKLIAVLTSAYSKVHDIAFVLKNNINDMRYAFELFFVRVQYGFAFLKSFAIETALAIVGALDDSLGQIIPGLSSKLASARNKLNGFSKDANAELAKIHNKTITITIRQVFKRIGEIVAGVAQQLKSSGGIVGSAATGGVRSGLTWVGENGPELLDLAPGSGVKSHPDSIDAMRNGAGGGPIIVQFIVDGKVLQEATIEPTRRFVSKRFGGNVQAAFGS